MVVTGNLGYARYITGFDGNGNPIYKDFGLGVVVNDISARKDVIPVYGVGCRQLQTLAEGRRIGEWSISFVLSDVNTLASIVSDLGILNSSPKAVGVEIAADNVTYYGYDPLSKTLQSWVRGMTASSRVNDVVRVNVNGISVWWGLGGGTTTESTCDDSGVPVTFADSSISVKDNSGANIELDGYVRAFTVSISSEVEPIYSIGDVYPKDVYGRVIRASGRVSLILEDIDAYTILNRSDIISVRFNLSSSDFIEITSAKFTEVRTSIRPGEVVEADLAITGGRVIVG